MNKYVKRYLIDAMSGMAQGLFASLLIGTIIKTLGQQLLRLSVNPVFQFLVDAGNFSTEGHVVGAAMAVGIGFAMGVPALVLFSLVAVGAAANVTGGAGGPLAVLVIAIIAAELGCLVSKKTKVDIIVTPAVTILAGALLTVLTAKYIGAAASSIGKLIVWSTKLHPFWMGIIVSVIVGVALTLPISSAAICAAFGLTGLAGGAAVAGCCAQMVGFAVMSFRENRWGGILSQGLGTSMLQMPNIIKNPKIWIAPILTSAITGPLATCLFKMEMNGAAVSSGMGTCGLVGQIGVITGWYEPSEVAIGHGAVAITPGFFNWLGLVLICFVLPAVLTWAFGLLFRKIGWIKEGDLSLEPAAKPATTPVEPESPESPANKAE
ncbi:MAG: PTS sugar transporter subunit IIC [Treponema sp.]|nr:PTS sugar transporter subunit IIC [Treponema sp.]